MATSQTCIDCKADYAAGASTCEFCGAEFVVEKKKITQRIVEAFIGGLAVYFFSEVLNLLLFAHKNQLISIIAAFVGAIIVYQHSTRCRFIVISR